MGDVAERCEVMILSFIAAGVALSVSRIAAIMLIRWRIRSCQLRIGKVSNEQTIRDMQRAEFWAVVSAHV